MLVTLLIVTSTARCSSCVVSSTSRSTTPASRDDTVPAFPTAVRAILDEGLA